MKKRIFTFLYFIFFAFPAVAMEAVDAEKFARSLADDIITNVVQPKLTLQKKQEIFRKIFMKVINVKTNARFTLGRYAKTADPDQLKAYTDALADNIIYTWTDRFNGYAGGSLTKDAIIIKSSRRSENGDFYVTSEINLPDTENDIEMIWRISEKKGTLKLADLIVEGVSMLMSYRNEYTAILQQNGGNIAALTEMLKKKNEALKNPAKK
ncbi:MAG: ABC transporter substrate-binding protein [Alphaproteobacteria bacterium]|nr:ABC transporter substrate-binding protein [Alphaproteobacteria bacterium]